MEGNNDASLDTLVISMQGTVSSCSNVQRPCRSVVEARLLRSHSASCIKPSTTSCAVAGDVAWVNVCGLPLVIIAGSAGLPLLASHPSEGFPH